MSSPPSAELDPGAFVNTADGVPNSRASLGNPFAFLSLQIPPSVLPLGVPGMDLPTTNGTLPTIFHETGNCERKQRHSSAARASDLPLG